MKKMSKKILFFGNEKLATGNFALEPMIKNAVLDASFEIEKIVTGAISDLGEHESQVAVLAAYGRIIPPSLLKQFPVGIINIHPSLLPQYRGPTPIEQAILDGADKTGVSLMKLSEKMDEGPIYKQKTVHLTGRETKPQLTIKLQKLGAELLAESLADIVSGRLKPRQQPHPDRATYCRKITKADGQLDFTKPANLIEREIRAYLGWPGSHTQIAGKDVIVTSAEVIKKQGTPGEISQTKNELIIYAGQDALRIERLKPAGKKEMSASEFIRGYFK